MLFRSGMAILKIVTILFLPLICRFISGSAYRVNVVKVSVGCCCSYWTFSLSLSFSLSPHTLDRLFVQGSGMDIISSTVTLASCSFTSNSAVCVVEVSVGWFCNYWRFSFCLSSVGRIQGVRTVSLLFRSGMGVVDNSNNFSSYHWCVGRIQSVRKVSTSWRFRLGDAAISNLSLSISHVSVEISMCVQTC
jgi:hypothetical protein